METFTLQARRADGVWLYVGHATAWPDRARQLGWIKARQAEMVRDGFTCRVVDRGGHDIEALTGVWGCGCVYAAHAPDACPRWAAALPAPATASRAGHPIYAPALPLRALRGGDGVPR